MCTLEAQILIEIKCYKLIELSSMGSKKYLEGPRKTSNMLIDLNV